MEKINKLIAYTDASFKDDKETGSLVSTHHWRIKRDGIQIKGGGHKQFSFKSEELSSMKAEYMTIESLIKYIVKHGLRNVEIRTDCLEIVRYIEHDIDFDDIDLTYLKLQLKCTGSKLKYVKRERNRIADHRCKELLITVLARENNNALKLYHIDDKIHRAFRSHYAETGDKMNSFDWVKVKISKLIRDCENKTYTYGTQGKICITNGLKIETYRNRVTSIKPHREKVAL